MAKEWNTIKNVENEWQELGGQIENYDRLILNIIFKVTFGAQNRKYQNNSVFKTL